MSDPSPRPLLTFRRPIAACGVYVMALLGGCFLIGAVLLLGHSSAVVAARSAWFGQLESVLLLDGTPILTGVILWLIAMLFYGGIPIVAGLLLWWITVRVDRQGECSKARQTTREPQC